MRVGVIAEGLLEEIGLRTGLAPVPLAEVGFAFLMARAVMAGTRLGFFEALAAAPGTAEEVAERCGTDAVATARLLRALVGCRYLRWDGERFALTAGARRFMLAASPVSCRDHLLWKFLEWEWCDHIEDYVRSGRPLDALSVLSEDQHGLYQRGMRAGVEPLAGELARRVRLARGARAMLDLGGGHGYYSVAFCRRHPGLSSTILERPEAIPHAAPLLAREGMGDRVVHQGADLRRCDLGRERYDLALLVALAHNFDDDENRALMGRVAGALRPGGVVVVFEPMRGTPREPVGQVAALMDLLLGTISPAGTRPAAQIAAWQREAGLVPRRPLRLHLAPDLIAQTAVKK